MERTDKGKIIQKVLEFGRSIDGGLAQAGSVNATDVQTLLHACAQFKEGGPPLHQVAAEWQAAHDQLPISNTLLDDAREFALRHPTYTGKPATVAAIVEEFLAAKKKGTGGLEPNYRHSLRAFAQTCGGKLSGEVLEAKILDYLAAQDDVGPCTRVNLCANIIQLFRFARRSSICPKSHHRGRHPGSVRSINNSPSNTDWPRALLKTCWILSDLPNPMKSVRARKTILQAQQDHGLDCRD